MIWFPLVPGLAEWLAPYSRVHRCNGGEPDAGRRLKAWAHEAGFTDVATTASVWNFSDAIGKGFASQADLYTMSHAWREWADSGDGWVAMPHGEIIARA